MMGKIDKIKVEYVNIVNIKCFEDVKINFDSSGTTLMLGTNARGKSLILQLLALGLNEVGRVPFPYNWKKVVKTGKDTGEFEIAVKIVFRHDEPMMNVNLKFQIDDNDTIARISGNDDWNAFRDQILILGYGASRNVKLEEPPPYKEMETVATLFGENSFLKHIKVSENFKYVSEKFNTIRPLINAVLDKADSRNKVLLESYNTSSFYFSTPSNPDKLIPIEALSEGFKSTFVWLFDMIIRAVEMNGDIDDVSEITGVILLDEVDLHLHPAWQRRILPSLEETFPNIQFIATTHSPFVAQSVKSENLIVLELDETASSVKVADKEISSELSYNAMVREIFNIPSPFNYDTEREMDEFHRLRDAIMKGEEIDKEEFEKTV